MFEVGRICLKIAGREAGKYCVVVKKLDENFVLVTGPKAVTSIKRRRCNINHLEPLPEKMDIKEDASDEDIIKEWKKSGLFKKFNVVIPETEIKEKKEKEELKEKAKPTRRKAKKEPKEASEDKTSKSS